MADVPYYQLTRSQTRLWPLGGEHRKRIAKAVVQRCPGGAAVVEFYGRVIAYVAPNEGVRELAPPFKRVHRHQIVNAPGPDQCACREYYDLESHGPWHLRPDAQGRHHPLCEFKSTAQAVFEAATRHPHARPDAILRKEAELLGQRGAKTGPRNG